MARIFFAADIHGSERCFRKLLNAAKFYGAQALVLGGDLSGKLLVPLVANPDGSYRSEWLGRDHIDAKELETLEGDLRASGAYTHRVSPTEMEELEANPRKTYDLFTDLMQARLRSWMQLAEERLPPQGVRLYCIFGNDDRLELDEVMGRSEAVVPFDGALAEVLGYEMVGFGFTNPTPWNTPRELPEQEMGRRLEALVSKVGDPGRAIFALHCPPWNTSLDLAPKLTRDMRLVARAGTVEMRHVGSLAVRSVLENHQPLLGLHGHIHESRGQEAIGRTPCLNPGSEYSEGLLHGAIVDLEGPRVKGIQFTVG